MVSFLQCITDKKANVKDRKQEITQVFDNIASKTSWEKLYLGKIDRISYNFASRQRAVEELLKPYAAGKALDIGCGSGDLVVFYSGKGVCYKGVDLSDSMINRANSNYANLVREGKADFKVADCENLPFNDGEFDILSAVALIEYLPDPSKALDEIFRVLKSGGYALITVPNKKCINNLFRSIFKPVTNLLFPLYVRMKKSPLALMRNVLHHSYSQEDIDLIMGNRGFHKIDERYTNFYVIPHPVDHIIPKTYIKISEKIDNNKLDKTYKNWAANYIAIYKKH